MSSWKEGDRIKIVHRAVTEDDRKNNTYFAHMGGLVGTVENVFAVDQIAVKIDPDSLSEVSRRVHSEATTRMREKLLASLSEEQKKQLTKEELDFHANYVLLLKSADLEKAS